MNITREDLLLGAAVALTSAAVAAGVTYFAKSRPKAPSAKSQKKFAVPATDKPIVLDESQLAVLKKFNDLFLSVSNQVPFNKEWYSDAGFMDGAIRHGLKDGAYASKDEYGRRIVILVSDTNELAGTNTTRIAYTRFAGDHSTINTMEAGNGKSILLSPSLDSMIDQLQAIVNNEKIVTGEVVKDDAAKAA